MEGRETNHDLSRRWAKGALAALVLSGAAALLIYEEETAATSRIVNKARDVIQGHGPGQTPEEDIMLETFLENGE